MTYLARPYAGALWRIIHPARQRALFSGEGARLYGGRWNMKGWPALYLAADHVTAVAEYYQGLPKPGMLVPYRIEAQAIADLTDGRGGAIRPTIASRRRWPPPGRPPPPSTGRFRQAGESRMS